MKKKIAVSMTSFAEYDSTPFSILKENNFEVMLNTLGHKLDKSDILEFCEGCIGILAGTEIYDRDILKRLVDLKAISRCGVGTDNIDITAAKELGIKIMNTPDIPTLAVAELTVGLIFVLLRHISLCDCEIRKGIWKKRMGRLIKDKHIGIIGFGKIGQKVADLLVSLGANIAYFDINPNLSTPVYSRKQLPELLSWSDIVTIHCSGQDGGKKIIGLTELEQMKRGALLINTARGELVDEDALYTSLKERYLGGAALDVYGNEPYSGKLREFDNVILTPHIGSYARESRIMMEIEAVNNLLEGLKG